MDDKECPCARVEAPQPSRSSVFFKKYVLLFKKNFFFRDGRGIPYKNRYVQNVCCIYFNYNAAYMQIAHKRDIACKLRI